MFGQIRNHWYFFRGPIPCILLHGMDQFGKTSKLWKNIILEKNFGMHLLDYLYFKFYSFFLHPQRCWGDVHVEGFCLGVLAYWVGRESLTKGWGVKKRPKLCSVVKLLLFNITAIECTGWSLSWCRSPFPGALKI